MTAASAGCASSAVTTVLDRARPAEQHAEPWLLFQRHCRSCHGALGAGNGPYAAAFRTPAPNLQSIVTAATDRDPLVQRILRSPPQGEGTENAMPAFGDVLTDGQARAIVALIARLAGETESEARDGAGIFRARCATCHGLQGRGDGPLAAELIPRPRDLTRSWYRFRSTPSGADPIHADLVASVTRGLGVTAMGGFGALGPHRVDLVAGYLGTLTTVAPHPVPAATTAPPEGGGADRTRGRELYDKAHCWQCHGPEGRGDGPSAHELRDDAGRASLPANLRRPWRLKGGADIDSLVRTIANGMNGTPMPSYGEGLAADELWTLARYVHSLGAPRPEVPRAVPVHTSEVALPRDPAAPFWQEARPTGVPLGPQGFTAPRWHRPAIDVAQVIVGWSADEMAFHLVWDDPSENRGSEDTSTAAASIDDPRRHGRWRLPDQLAVRLTRIPADGVLPPLSGGSPDAPVVRWVWSADEESPRIVTSHGLDDEPPPQIVGLAASATFHEGRWQLVLIRSRADAEAGRLLAPGARMALSLELWEGSQGERGARHALSSWIPFTLPER